MDSVTVTALTWVRATSTTALPYTTSAMLRPALPPIRKVGSDGLRRTAAEDTGVWVQSSTEPLVTEVRFNWSTRLVPMSFTASTPCN